MTESSLKSTSSASSCYLQWSLLIQTAAITVPLTLGMKSVTDAWNSRKRMENCQRDFTAFLTTEFVRGPKRFTAEATKEKVTEGDFLDWIGTSGACLRRTYRHQFPSTWCEAAPTVYLHQFTSRWGRRSTAPLVATGFGTQRVCDTTNVCSTKNNVSVMQFIYGSYAMSDWEQSAEDDCLSSWILQ